MQNKNKVGVKPSNDKNLSHSSLFQADTQSFGFEFKKVQTRTFSPAFSARSSMRPHSLRKLAKVEVRIQMMKRSSSFNVSWTTAPLTFRVSALPPLGGSVCGGNLNSNLI